MVVGAVAITAVFSVAVMQELDRIAATPNTANRAWNMDMLLLPALSASVIRLEGCLGESISKQVGNPRQINTLLHSKGIIFKGAEIQGLGGLFSDRFSA
jgi:hypothetical protein